MTPAAYTALGYACGLGVVAVVIGALVEVAWRRWRAWWELRRWRREVGR